MKSVPEWTSHSLAGFHAEAMQTRFNERFNFVAHVDPIEVAWMVASVARHPR